MDKPHFSVLPEHQKLLWDQLVRHQWIEPFYLAGGTSLALHIGHRRSVDFDFFTSRNFDTREIIGKLRNLGEFELFHEAGNTLNGSVNNVRISFFSYRYPLIGKLHKHVCLSVADLIDIALMKLEAISGRGSRKDFIDLYFLLHYFSLTELFEQYPFKYGKQVSNHYHLLKSLIYFEDAEEQPMPVMVTDISWEQVRKSIIAEVKKIRIIV